MTFVGVSSFAGIASISRAHTHKIGTMKNARMAPKNNSVQYELQESSLMRKPPSVPTYIYGEISVLKA